ncbi:MAG TPA: tyrosine-type recombinase/integrase [Steroidobacteraceae bacterium]|jgi:integrase
MSLTVQEIKAAIREAAASGKTVKRFDERGLFFQAKPTGAAGWRLKFMLDGREKLISLGKYPDVSLAQARDNRDEERRKISKGVNPADERRAERDTRGNTFRAMAEDFLKSQTGVLSAGTITRHERRLERFVYKHIGGAAIETITAQELLAVLRKIEAQGKTDTAKRVRELCSQIWVRAIHEGKAQHDIAHSLKGAITIAPKKSHAAITDPKKLGSLMRAIDGYDGHPLTLGALKLSALLFVRPGELRRMEWSEVDLDDATWRIPGPKMKMKDPHVVPLATQAVAVLRALQAHSGDSSYVFPSLQTNGRPMSENTVNAALKRMGYSGDEHVAHGFRSTASTILNENGQDPDVIELQLAHKPRGVRAVYNRSSRLDDRRKMIQWYADYLDKVRASK